MRTAPVATEVVAAVVAVVGMVVVVVVVAAKPFQVVQNIAALELATGLEEPAGRPVGMSRSDRETNFGGMVFVSRNSCVLLYLRRHSMTSSASFLQ